MRPRLLFVFFSVLMMAGCSAPPSTVPSGQDATGPSSTAPSESAPNAEVRADDTPSDAANTGDAQQSATPGQTTDEEPPLKGVIALPSSGSDGKGVDYSCRSDADCAIKNVGNCCGYYPACVNVDSPTFPEQVQAECAASGLSGICGFPSLTGCQCVNNRCEGVTGPGPVETTSK